MGGCFVTAVNFIQLHESECLKLDFVDFGWLNEELTEYEELEKNSYISPYCALSFTKSVSANGKQTTSPKPDNVAFISSIFLFICKNNSFVVWWWFSWQGDDLDKSRLSAINYKGIHL